MDRPQRISVRELRANLRAALRSEKPISVGNDYELRAIIVPIPPHQNWPAVERKKAIVKARRAFKQHADAEAENA
jgi:hypothetical protein